MKLSYITIILGLSLLYSSSFGQITIKDIINPNGLQVFAAEYSKDGKYIALATNDKNIKIYKSNGFELVATLEGLKQTPISIDFSADGRYIAAAGIDKKITVWSLTTAKIFQVFKGHREQINCIEFSNDSKYIASASNDKSIIIWNISNKSKEKTLTGHTLPINCIDYSLDGNKIVSASVDKTIIVWETSSGNKLKVINAHLKNVNSVKFNSDASVIISGGDDKHLNLWDTYSGQKLNTLFIHKEGILTVDFSPDGNYILSGGKDNLAIITNLQTGKMEFKSQAENGYINFVQFSPDGTSFITLSDNKRKIQVWNSESLNIKPIVYKAIQKTTLSSGEVPKIEWILPEDRADLIDASVKISAKIYSESSLQNIKVFLNGDLFSTKTRAELMLETTENNYLDFNDLVVLKEGINKLLLRATNTTGEGLSNEIEVTFINLPEKALSWISPAQPELETSTQSFLLKALVTPSVSKQTIDIYINGRKQNTKQMPSNGGILTQKVSLSSGENEILLKIITSKYVKEAELRKLIFTPAEMPLVQWISPTIDTVSNISFGRVKAQISSRIPIDKVEIKVDNISVYNKQRTGLKNLEVNQQVNLSFGNNAITIVATNKMGETISTVRNILYERAEKTAISWILPGTDTMVYEPLASINACIQSKINVHELKVFNNNKLLYTVDSPSKESLSECYLNYNKKIKLTPGNNRIKLTAENKGGITESEIRNIKYVIPTLATIDWVEPVSPNTENTEGTATIQVCIQSNSALKSYGILLNNKLFSNTRDPLPTKGDCNYDIKQVIPLQNGDNKIILRTVNLAGETFSTPINIEYKTANPYRFALIFGNEDYSSYQSGLESESDVDFAINDAKGFKDMCVSVLGIKEENILYYENARFMEMKRGLGRISTILKSTQGKAELLVYFAGHGFPHEQTKEPYLIPVDASGTDLEFGGIKLIDFYASLTEYPSQRVTVFIDACFSGGARNQGLLAARGVKIVPKKTEEAVRKKLVVFTASSGNQSSLPYKEKKHGMFTYYLLKEMEKTNGDVSYEELSKYLKEEVSIRSILVNGKEQDPQTNISAEIQEEWKQWRMK